MAKSTTVKPVPTGIRVSQLAKEFGIPSKVLLEKAQELKIEVKNASSTLTRGQADRLRAKFGSSEELRAALEQKRKSAKKKPVKAAQKDEAEVEVEADEVEEAAETEVAEPAVEEVAAAVEPAEAPPVQAPEPEPEVQPAAPVVEAPAPAPLAVEAKPEPEKPREVRFLQAGPDISPPMRGVEPANAADTRFGVVMTADKAREVHGEAQTVRDKRGRTTAVESKAVDDFKAQVSYPKMAELSAEEDAKRGFGVGGAGGAGRGRRPAGRVAGGRRSRRHGAALLNDEERVRGRRKAQRKSLDDKPAVVRSGQAEVASPVTVKNLCEALGIKSTLLIAKFFQEGKMVRINDILTDSDAELYAAEFDPLGFGIKIKKARDIEEELLSQAEREDRPEDLVPRAPVVTVMGHVDHGKTSLLDSIRKTKVAAGEAGGITQHIGAYRIRTARGDVTFLDTPGHKAFTEMRARGANVTDMVILVVAANDGVMPQTEEAISHTKAAKKPMIVALNKIDLKEANPEKVKGELAAKEVIVEDYGGQVGCLPVSALTGNGIDELLDRIVLESELLELKANPNKHAVGTVVEAHKDQGRGIVATLLVQEGTLKPGDVLVAGHAYGTVRQLLDDTGAERDEAGPSDPVLITGLNDVPLAGERFHVLDDIKMAAEVAENRAMALRQEGLSARQHVTLENLHDMLAQGQVASLRLIVKVDVMGSLNPVINAAIELSTSEVKVEVIHSAVGSINETDIHLADASDAILIGFNVTADPGARRLADERGVEIRTYKVIYELLEECRKALEGLLKPIEKEVVQGHLEVRQTFKISRVGTVAGCYVTDGTIQRNSSVRLVRDGKPVWTGRLGSLKRVKDDAREVREGFECGLKLDGYDDVKSGDTIEVFAVEKIARTLEGAEKK
ncbi:MAG: translation initiation factor IF-2 [Planctomycetota bacterium]|nr:translation initiation factor IF-2 [Planctomycetota bacterium]